MLLSELVFIFLGHVSERISKNLERERSKIAAARSQVERKEEDEFGVGAVVTRLSSENSSICNSKI